MIIKLKNGAEIEISTYTFVNFNFEIVSKEEAQGIICIQQIAGKGEIIEIGGKEFYHKSQIINWSEL